MTRAGRSQGARLRVLPARLGAMILAMALAACGGGGASDPAKDTVLLPGGGVSVPPPPAAAAPALSVGVFDQVSGAARNTISFTAGAIARAVVTDGSGAPVAGAVVRFESSDRQAVVFSPAATALTDASGLASTGVAPASLATAGAFTITASAQVGDRTAVGSTGVAVAASPVALGELVAGVSPVSAYGTTVVSVPVSGVPASTAVQVRFTSVCAAQTPARATITPLVPVAGGVARATYVDRGCAGEDLITATVEGTSISRAASLAVLAPAVANIQFVSASPYVIAQRGTGGTQGPGNPGLPFPEISTVRFQVVDEAGAPVASPTSVTLRLSNDTGGILIDQTPGPVVKQTDANGFVEVQVQSGTLPTPVWVIASIVAGSRTLTTNSVQLAVSTGQPAQARFSASASIVNCEGWDFDGFCAKVQVIAADALGNPVPDGTAVSFISDRGMVEANCQTGVDTGLPLPGIGAPGRCEVDLFSQGVRPPDGRVAWTAYAVGEEHYEDADGNNRYDPGETFYDMGYLFLDSVRNGRYDAGERFVPYLTAQSGTCASNALPLLGTASVPGTCDGAWGRAHVRSGGVVVFSGSRAYFRTSPLFAAPNASNLPTSLSLGPSCSAQLGFWLQDLNGNPLPYQTTIDVDPEAAQSLKVSGRPQEVGNTNAIGGTFHLFTVSGTLSGGSCTGSGQLAIRVETPAKIRTDFLVNVTP